MERKVNSSVAEADACEAKVELMEGVLVKLKGGTEEVGRHSLLSLAYENQVNKVHTYKCHFFLSNANF